ncbi:MAG: hypothetical protein M3Q36_03125 [bacterium]|nr:hypothetical protein [bacterium]
MKNNKYKLTKRLIAIILALVTTCFALLGSVSLSSMPVFFQLVIPFLLGGLVFVLFDKSLKASDEHYEHTQFINRVLAQFIVLTLLASTWYGIQSLWIDVSDDTRNRFVLENIATGTTITAAILTLILSTLQSDVYWLTKRRPGTLDERQMRERHEVFETSYKLGAFLSVLTVWGYVSTIDSVDRIKEFYWLSDTLPGHYFIPAYCFVIALVALPLIVAATKKR